MVDSISDKVLKDFNKYFNMGVKPGAELPKDRIFPMDFKRDVEGNRELKRVKFDDEISKLYTWWLSNTHDSADSWKDRKAVWEDMEILYYNCLGADEKLLTQERGLVSISSVVGEELTLLTSKGWQKGKIDCFGKKEVYDVHFKRRGRREDRVVTATLNHRWRISDGSFVETKDLKECYSMGYTYIPSTKISYVSAPREIDENSLDYIYGVRHGIIYGDGTTIKKCERTLGYNIRICSDQEDILPYFQQYHVCYPPSYGGNPVISMWDDFSKTHALKELPSENETNDYLIGFFRGLFAADGYIDKIGRASITCGRQDADWMRRVLAKVGIQFTGQTPLSKRKQPSYIKGKEVILKKDCVEIRIDLVTFTEDDILIARKRRRFKQVNKPVWSFDHINYSSKRVEDVYCAIVPETTDFVLEDGLLTGNSPLIARAIELIADEVIQADSNDQPIFVEAKRNVKKFILDFFDDIGIYNLLRPAMVDIIQFGNCGWLLGFDKKGVSEIIPIDIMSFKDRLEFTPYEIKQKIEQKDAFMQNYSAMDRIQSLIDSILDKEDSTSYFKKYLFGFQIEDRVVPPWKFLHFRNPTNKSPFKPFGVPVFIGAMAPYRQYDSAMTLQQTARMSRFPKWKFDINLPNTISPSDKVEKAIELMNEYLNVGMGNSRKELPGMGDYLFTIKDLFDFSDITPNIDLGKIDDIEMLRDELIVATQLPRYIIDPKDPGFGDTGVAMVEKWKPFARLVYRMQSVLLENITQLVKIHMIYSQEFAVEDIDFTLSMKFPESQTNQDIVSSQNALLDLSNNIINAIQDKVTGGEALPPELIKSIYTQFLPYDTSKIESWIDDALKHKDAGETTPTVDSEQNKRDIFDIQNPSEEESTYTPDETDDKQMERLIRKAQAHAKIENLYKIKAAKQVIRETVENQESARSYWRMYEKQVGKSELQEAVREIKLEEQQKVIRECRIRDKHVYSSKNKYMSFPAEQLREFDKKRIKKLSESVEDKQYYKEEVEYIFKRPSEPPVVFQEETYKEIEADEKESSLQNNDIVE
jgi:hypothetical protein